MTLILQTTNLIEFANCALKINFKLFNQATKVS